MIDGIGSLLDWLNPLSENFFGKQIINSIGSLFQSLFIPSQERLEAIPNIVKSKFGFVDSIKNTIEGLKYELQHMENSATISMTLGATKYTNSMDINIIDMSFYAPFKPYGDILITAFCYIGFLWRIFVNLGNIVSGFGVTADTYIKADKLISSKSNKK